MINRDQRSGRDTDMGGKDVARGFDVLGAECIQNLAVFVIKCRARMRPLGLQGIGAFGFTAQAFDYRKQACIARCAIQHGMKITIQFGQDFRIIFFVQVFIDPARLAKGAGGQV